MSHYDENYLLDKYLAELDELEARSESIESEAMNISQQLKSASGAIVGGVLYEFEDAIADNEHIDHQTRKLLNNEIELEEYTDFVSECVYEYAVGLAESLY